MNPLNIFKTLFLLSEMDPAGVHSSSQFYKDNFNPNKYISQTADWLSGNDDEKSGVYYEVTLFYDLMKNGKALYTCKSIP